MSKFYSYPIKFTPKYKALIYLTQIPIMYILLVYHPIKNHILFEAVFYLIFILFALTFGWSDTSLYLQKNDKSLKQILVLALQLYCFQIIISSAVILLMKNSDPQGIKNMSYSFNYYLSNHVVQTIILAFSEEFFKFTIFIAILSLINMDNKFNIFISIIFTSFIFGAMHAINYKQTAMIPIMFNTIPCFIYLLKYKSLYILIAAHFIFDTIAFISHVEPLGHETIQFAASAILVFIIVNQVLIPKIKRVLAKS